ncbi:FAD-dependent monooxygenase [Rhodoferax sp.]|uniref:FAD-dependent monooxygenase n=1 Tax=Rhodoferax sp. TaxID=50421 RepID=UPI00374D3EC8
MAQPFDICIRGAGIVGRTLALLLARDRLRVALVADAAHASTADDLRAYALNTASRNLLESLRCWPDAEHATAVQQMHVWGDKGGEVTFNATEQNAAALAWIVDVPALEARLGEAVRYQPMIEIVSAPVEATLTAVCEGKASATRAELGIDFDSLPYHQHAIATRLVCEKPHGQVARQWFADGEILAFLPLQGDAGNSVAVVWSVQEARAAELQALSPEDFAQALQVASHGALGALTLDGPRGAWPLHKAQARKWIVQQGSRSWVLAGDAAHTVHPLAGQGLNLGLGDAAELAQVLHARDYWRSVADSKLLRQYERSRKTALLAVGGATDGLQQLFARDDATWQGLRNWGMRGFERSGLVKSWVARQAMGLETIR